MRSMIGYMYYYGKGVVEDRKKAWFWIKAAANVGQPDAKVAAKMLDGNMNSNSRSLIEPPRKLY